jgi:phosphatidylglycerol:prolipoprotein diacylglycerol transferase
MHPVLIDGVRAYPASVVWAVAVGMAALYWSARRAGVAAPARLYPYFCAVGVAALLGGKLHSLLERGGHLHALAWELQNGSRYPGAIIGLVLAVWLMHRRTGLGIAALADVIVPTTALAMAAGRIGCFLEGCCYGTPSALPWAVQFPVASHAWNAHVAQGLISSGATLSLPVHPLQLYFALLALAVGLGLLWLQAHKTYDGQVFLAFLAVHETGKYLLEFLRGEPVWHVATLSLAFAVLAGSVLLTLALVRRRFAPLFTGSLGMPPWP